MNAYLEAYGCALNIGESREIESYLSELGWELSESSEDADLVILVTCVVIEKTERAMLERLGALSSSRRIVVAGCMATACPDKASRIAPHASFLPPGDMSRLSQLVSADPVGPNRRGSAEYPVSIVPISTGCVGRCAYCITRTARGTLRSRTEETIVRSVQTASSSGPREIQLTSQDVACYGRDTGMDLPTLVKRICALPEDFRLRVGMMNPRSVLPLLDSLADMYLEPRLFKFLHLPIQSGSDDVLSSMDRDYTVADFLKVLESIRARAPSLSLSTDVIVGYPGETDDDHARTIELIETIRPDIVNITKFSPRPGTKAAGLRRDFTGKVVADRSREMTRVRFAVAQSVNDGWVGVKTKVLATEPGKSNSTITRTDEYRQVVIPDEVPLGDYYEVRITGATPTYLIGVLE